mmetsp:Transcript_3408/g.9246  ORF Transcript_3408/g.9246 Transcript_3408/m.9246 type:complete len:275 (+) Transcript_3408:211-1035(+)
MRALPEPRPNDAMPQAEPCRGCRGLPRHGLPPPGSGQSQGGSARGRRFRWRARWPPHAAGGAPRPWRLGAPAPAPGALRGGGLLASAGLRLEDRLPSQGGRRQGLHPYRQGEAPKQYADLVAGRYQHLQAGGKGGDSCETLLWAFHLESPGEAFSLRGLPGLCHGVRQCRASYCSQAPTQVGPSTAHLQTPPGPVGEHSAVGSIFFLGGGRLPPSTQRSSQGPLAGQSLGPARPCSHPGTPSSEPHTADSTTTNSCTLMFARSWPGLRKISWRS